jgi:hypothetical protein
MEPAEPNVTPMSFTKDEATFLLDLVSRVNVQPLDPNAVKSIELLQSVNGKLLRHIEDFSVEGSEARVVGVSPS